MKVIVHDPKKPEIEDSIAKDFMIQFICFFGECYMDRGIGGDTRIGISKHTYGTWPYAVLVRDCGRVDVYDKRFLSSIIRIVKAFDRKHGTNTTVEDITA